MTDNSTVDNTTVTQPVRPQKGLFKSFFNFFGGKTLSLNNDIGAMSIFFFRSFIMMFRLKAIPDIIQQVYYIGAKSAQIVMLVGFFTGMVLGLQLYFVLVDFGSVGVLGTAIALTLIREMGPVLAAIMITARAGSAMTAEIGIQRISEQIDALSTMRIDPLAYLISPRIAAAIISFPILTAFFDLIGIIGAWVSGCLILGVNSGSYFYRVVSSTQIDDITGGFIKSIVFGLLIITICCFQGYFTHMRTDSFGAKSVSLSTTSAVVISCVMILISDYIVNSFIL
jgi:phospholipid/cholesterol/gamma-HCH transport system permease protein